MLKSSSERPWHRAHQGIFVILELNFFIVAENQELMVKTVSTFWYFYFYNQTNNGMPKRQCLKFLADINREYFQIYIKLSRVTCAQTLCRKAELFLTEKCCLFLCLWHKLTYHTPMGKQHTFGDALRKTKAHCSLSQFCLYRSHSKTHLRLGF